MLIDQGIDDQQDESLLAQMRPSMNMKQPKNIQISICYGCWDMTTTNLFQCMHWLSLMIIDEGIDDQQDESFLAQMRPSMNVK